MTTASNAENGRKRFAIGAIVITFVAFCYAVISNSLENVIDYIGNCLLQLEHTEVTIYGELRFHFLDFLGTLMTCKMYRQCARKSPIVWIECIVSCVILTFGGSSSVAFLLGQAPWWALRHGSGLAFLLGWWFVFCSPFDIVWEVLQSHYVTMPIEVLCAVSSGHAITSWGMDRVIFNNFHPDPLLLSRSIGFSLISGIVASTGGGVVGNYFNLLEKKTYHINGNLTLFQNSPDGDAARSRFARNFLLSCIYLYILNPAGYFPGPVSLHNRAFGKQVVCSLSVLRCLVHFLWHDWHPLTVTCARVLYIVRVPKLFFFTIKQKRFDKFERPSQKRMIKKQE